MQEPQAEDPYSMKTTRRSGRRQDPKTPNEAPTPAPSNAVHHSVTEVRPAMSTVTEVRPAIEAETEIKTGDKLTMTWRSGRGGLAGYPVIRARVPRKRRTRQSALLDGIFRQLFPPDGKPPSREEMSDF